VALKSSALLAADLMFAKLSALHHGLKKACIRERRERAQDDAQAEQLQQQQDEQQQQCTRSTANLAAAGGI
jgi:hypothetical protein